MIGDAEEFMSFVVKESLQNEVTLYHTINGNYNNNYITFIKNFLEMFNGGKEEKSVHCTLCNNSKVTSKENFDNLRLGFDDTHYNKKILLVKCWSIIQGVVTMLFNFIVTPAVRTRL